MAWLRFAQRRGINLDNCVEWTYEDRVIPVEPVVEWHPQLLPDYMQQDPMGIPTPEVPLEEAAGEGATEETPAAMQDTEPVEPVIAEPLPTCPTLRLLMYGGGEVVLEDEDATRALAYLVGLTGAL